MRATLICVSVSFREGFKTAVIIRLPANTVSNRGRMTPYCKMGRFLSTADSCLCAVRTYGRDTDGVCVTSDRFFVGVR